MKTAYMIQELRTNATCARDIEVAERLEQLLISLHRVEEKLKNAQTENAFLRKKYNSLVHDLKVVCYEHEIIEEW